jgi:hypothetical protein
MLSKELFAPEFSRRVASPHTPTDSRFAGFVGPPRSTSRSEGANLGPGASDLWAVRRSVLDALRL